MARHDTRSGADGYDPAAADLKQANESGESVLLDYRADRWSGEDGAVDFLRPGYVEWACAAVRLPEPIASALIEGAAAIRENGESAGLARRFHRELFIDKTARGETNGRLLASGERAGMLAALVYLGGLPQTIAYYEAKRLPEAVLVDTLDDMAIWMRHYYNERGEWGLGQVSWLIRHLSGELFRLGRLQFAFMPYNKPFKAFRHRATGRVAALSEAGVRYRADGKADGTNGVFDPATGWTSELTMEGSTYTGHPVRPDGTAARLPITLSAAEWELVLERGDTVLDVHIPEGAKMSHALCRDSYGQALAFAADYFPERPFRAFVCSSWLLAPQFPLLLPPDSNIVRFRGDYSVTPGKDDERQTLERVFGFGATLADLPGFPRDTSLRRAVYDHLAAGHPIHGASGFLLKDDWDKGTGVAELAEGT